jgi:hypothetical protein
VGLGAGLEGHANRMGENQFSLLLLS